MVRKWAEDRHLPTAVAAADGRQQLRTISMPVDESSCNVAIQMLSEKDRLQVPRNAFK